VSDTWRLVNAFRKVKVRLLHLEALECCHNDAANREVLVPVSWRLHPSVTIAITVSSSESLQAMRVAEGGGTNQTAIKVSSWSLYPNLVAFLCFRHLPPRSKTPLPG
jgi:hypothetical protein